jgi:hypothetical protein
MQAPAAERFHKSGWLAWADATLAGWQALNSSSVMTQLLLLVAAVHGELGQTHMC